MPSFSSKRRVRHTASQMFDLVADVERYPEFVPLCQSLKIRQRTPKDDGTEIIVADMTVSFKLVRETFTSRVTLDRPNLNILVEYLKGPFSNLETVPSKYLTVRPGARYFASLRLLQQVKELDARMFTKSGIMVGLGEERNEVLQLMDDLRAADVD